MAVKITKGDKSVTIARGRRKPRRACPRYSGPTAMGQIAKGK